MKDVSQREEFEPESVKSLFVYSKARYPLAKEFCILLKRCFIVHWRENKLTSGSSMQTTAIALIIGWIYYGQKMNQTSIMNINGALFIMLMQNAIVPAVDVADVSFGLEMLSSLF